jgi:hypothetical protein
LRGAGAAAYSLGTFDFDATTNTATWTLPSPLTQDRLQVLLGDSRGYFNVLAGDANRDGLVNALDLADVKRRSNSTTATGVGAGYSVFADVTGDGRINALDLGAMKRRLNSRLPPAESPTFVPPLLATPGRQVLAVALNREIIG